MLLIGKLQTRNIDEIIVRLYDLLKEMKEVLLNVNF
jgi:hypothetical protein